MAVIIAVQLLAAVVFALKPTAVVALVLACVGAVVVLDRPILGVGLLISARLFSTGATVFVRIGRMGIGTIEPVLLLCLMPLVFHAAINGKKLWRDWPWRAPLLVLIAWIALALMWSV